MPSMLDIDNKQEDSLILVTVNNERGDPNKENQETFKTVFSYEGNNSEAFKLSP